MSLFDFLFVALIAAAAYYFGYQHGRASVREPEREGDPSPLPGPRSDPLPGPSSIPRPRAAPPPASAGGDAGDGAGGDARMPPRRSNRPPPPAAAGLLDKGSTEPEGGAKGSE